MVADGDEARIKPAGRFAVLLVSYVSFCCCDGWCTDACPSAILFFRHFAFTDFCPSNRTHKIEEIDCSLEKQPGIDLENEA